MNLVQQTDALEPQFREIVGKAIDKTAFVDVVTGSADNEFSIEHGLGTIPLGYLVISRDATVVVYKSTTPWDTDHIYLKGTASGVGIRLLIF
jgi:hypothetical protein